MQTTHHTTAQDPHSSGVVPKLRAQLLAEQQGLCARCGRNQAYEVVQGPSGYRALCPACFLKLPAVRARLETLPLRRGDPVHRFVKWQAFERDAGKCRRCGTQLAPADARVTAVDRRLAPDLDNVITLCRTCLVRKTRRSRADRQAAATLQPAPPVQEQSRAVDVRGARHLLHRRYAASAGRCNLCGTHLTSRVARMLRLARTGAAGEEGVLLVCPDCKAGGGTQHRPDGRPVPLLPQALEQFKALTGVAARRAPFTVGMIMRLGVLTGYRMKGCYRRYEYRGLQFTVCDGRVIALQVEPGWSPVRWPGTRAIRQEYHQHRAEPELSLVTLRLPNQLLEQVHTSMARQGPGWSLELWLVHILQRAVTHQPVPERIR